MWFKHLRNCAKSMSDKRIFVQIPSNQPGGGVKVANQLVNLFRSKNYEAYIVLPREAYPADWFCNPAAVINFSEAKKLCRPSDIVIDNSNDIDTIAQMR